MNKLYVGDIILVTKEFTLGNKQIGKGKYRVQRVGELESFWRNHFYRVGVELFGKTFETFPCELCEVHHV